jgi:hypothetical protein
MAVDIQRKTFIVLDSMSKNQVCYQNEATLIKNTLAHETLLGVQAKNWPVIVC